MPRRTHPPNGLSTSRGIRQFVERFRKEPTREWFAAELIHGIREAGDTATYRFEPAEGRIVRLVDGEPSGTIIHLSNMFPTYLDKPPAERAGYLGVCIRSILSQHREVPGDFDAARADLRPRLYSRLTLEHVRLNKILGEVGPDFDEMPSEPIGAHLVLGLAYDWPESVQSINRTSLDAWDVTIFEAMEPARDNLREVTQGYGKVGDSLYVFISGDSYDASRLALTDLIGSLEAAGRPVAMAPNRESLLVTGSEDEAGLTLLAELGEECLAEPYANVRLASHPQCRRLLGG